MPNTKSSKLNIILRLATLLEGAGCAFYSCEVKVFSNFNNVGIKAVKLERNVSVVKFNDSTIDVGIKNECFKSL